MARGGINAIGRYRLLLYIAVYPQCKRCIDETKPKAKSTTLTFRIEPSLKEALRTAAVSLVRDGRHGLEVLMMERNLQSVFVPGNYVFPGGAVDAQGQKPAVGRE